MRIPLSWLNDYVDVKDIPVRELAERLTLAGLEVEGIEIIGHPGAALPWDPQLIRTAEVVAVQPHPDADRLVLAEVNYGGTEHEIVVTGAPSLYERKGQTGLSLKVAFAWEGALLYDGHAEGWVQRKLKAGKIRGITSRAMVCSEKELGLADEQTDIIYLPDDTPVGIPLVDVLGDYVLSFDIKGPFGHLQSVYGVAREVAALFKRPLRRAPLEAFQRLGLRRVEQPDFVELVISAPDLCPRYTATLIRNVTIGPSPLWMQMRLRRAGMRPINNVVDITNYVMLELGEPLHAFDYRDLRPRPGSSKPVIDVRRAHPGETMATLDGVERVFDGEMCLITDGGGPVAVGGVMGGLNSEVKPDTSTVLLEAASFKFINIRRTSQTLKLFTESAARFGKRVDPELAALAGARAAELMAQLAGGTVVPEMGDLYPGRPEPVTLSYSPALADRILGVKIAPEEQRRILEALEFSLAEEEETWQVTVPSHRQDVRLPVDLVEEVARIHGYDQLPLTLIDEPLPPLRRNTALLGEEQLRDRLVKVGLDEVITYSLVDPQDEGRLAAGGKALALPGTPLTLRNPLAPERSQMRRTLLPGLLRTAWSNLRHSERIAIFEIGRIYYRTGAPQVALGQTGVAEPRRVALLLTGPRAGAWWQASDRTPLDYFDLKGIVDELLRELALEAKVRWQRSAHPALHPGRSAEVYAGELLLGSLGELHPRVRAAFDLPDQPVLVLEWDLEALLQAAGAAESSKKVGMLSPYPPIHEDLALVVDEATPALEVQRAILEGGYPLVTEALLFDIYRGEQVGAGKKSLAFALTYQAPDKLLDEKDVERLRKRILKAAEQRVGAKLRGVA